MQITGNTRLYPKYTKIRKTEGPDLYPGTPGCSYYSSVIKEEDDSVIIKINYFHIITVRTLLFIPIELIT